MLNLVENEISMTTTLQVSDAPAVSDAPMLAATPKLRDMAQLPGPKGIPVFGNILQIESSRLHLQLEDWCREFGPYYRLNLLKRRVLVVGDHSSVATVLRDRPEGFRRSSRLEDIWREMGLPPGVFGAHGDAWRRQRRMVMAGFDPAHVKSYFPTLQKVAERLVGRWQQAAQQGHTIELQADLMRYTVDTIAGLAFGADVNTLESDADVIQKHLDKLFPVLFHRILSPFPIWRYVKTAKQRDFEHSVTEVLAAVDGFVATARARIAAQPGLKEHPNNLLEAMINAADQPDSAIDARAVSGNVLTMLLAGEDTTANTLAWMIHLLWKHPESLARATVEVRAVLGDAAEPSLEHMAKLDFVEACAHETMRLKPVAPLLAMQALQDTVVGDVRVPKGTVVFCMLRRDSVSDNHVSDAASFDPSRWLQNASPSQNASAAKRISMPFGAGPRICPGRYLALLEMKMAIAVLLGRFDIQEVGTTTGRDPIEHLAFAMAPVGLRMRLREREDYKIDSSRP